MFAIMSVCLSTWEGFLCDHCLWCHWSITGHMTPPQTCLILFTWEPQVNLRSGPLSEHVHNSEWYTTRLSAVDLRLRPSTFDWNTYFFWDNWPSFFYYRTGRRTTFTGTRTWRRIKNTKPGSSSDSFSKFIKKFFTKTVKHESDAWELPTSAHLS